MDYKQVREQRIQEMYANVPAYIKEDICEAALWTRTTLTDLEGSGHCIYVTADEDGLVCCSFAKPSWAGDHCGRGMEDGAQAMVMAVCEYLCGA